MPELRSAYDRIDQHQNHYIYQKPFSKPPEKDICSFNDPTQLEVIPIIERLIQIETDDAANTHLKICDNGQKLRDRMDQTVYVRSIRSQDQSGYDKTADDRYDLQQQRCCRIQE